MDFWVIVKKTQWKEVKNRLNAKLEHHLAELYALLHEVSAFIYIIIYYRWVSFTAIGSK